MSIDPTTRLHLRVVDDPSSAAYLAELDDERADRDRAHRSPVRSSTPAAATSRTRATGPVDVERFRLTDVERERGLDRVAELRRLIDATRARSTWRPAP